MAGMYPDNQSIELFGESVQWPGVDAGGKFTNGSFSDPQVKPSFIPAQTINLILDNLGALITELGGTPNNTGPKQLATLCTAVKLLERIKAVAGANSGLDADTLDGQQGTYYAPVGSPNLTGTPTAPTAAAGTNNTQIATTAFVKTAVNGVQSSPSLTGTPTAPTAAAGTNNTQIATTAFVQAAIDQIKAIIRGFMVLGLTNLDNSAAPQISQGSIVEIGGSIYIGTASKTVTGIPSNNGVNYIYAVSDGNNISFSYASTQPVWDTPKGGWYNGNNRAVALFFMNGTSYLGKRVLGNASDDLIPYDTGTVTSGGTLIESTTGTGKKKITLKRGFYRIELAGSSGGNGGDVVHSGPGGKGGAGGYINTMVYIPASVTATIFSAEKGGNGGDGGHYDGSDNPDGYTGSGGGGGGGCAGFICYGLSIFWFAFGGGGGGGTGGANTGSASDDNGSGGGGGGGGDGTDGTDGTDGGEEGDGSPGKGGTGGTTGKGGNGGKGGRLEYNDPEIGGNGYGYALTFFSFGKGGDGGDGGKGKERGGHEQPGETGKNGSPGGNSINFDTGGAPLGDGFVKVYRIA